MSKAKRRCDEKYGLQNYQLRDRFQGAVLGVALAPPAISYLFRSSPRDITQVEKVMPTWLILIATLLRAHDHSAENRHRKIVAEGTRLSANSPEMAQQLILSDILAWILTGKGDRWGPQTAGARLTLRSLATEISPSDRAETASPTEAVNLSAVNLSMATQRSELYRHYHGLWTVILSRLHAESLLHHPVTLTLDEQSAHQFMLTGVLSTVSQLSSGGHYSYSALMAIAMNNAFVPDVKRDERASFNDTFSETFSSQVPLACGLLAGAALGRSELPVLWQNTTCLREEPLHGDNAIALANQCFDQWLGRLT